MKAIAPGILLLSLPLAGAAADPVFDVHVHLWDGEASVQAYTAQVESAGRRATGFGGIHMARRGELADTTAKNDALLELAGRHLAMLAIGSVHPYDGEAALAELTRVAGRGMRAIKLHAHTQKFDAADPRVLAVCRRAGELGLVVLVDNASIVPGDSEKLFDLAIRAPDTDFVFTHLGGMNFRFWNILPMARTAEGLLGDNIHFDISATVTLLADSPLEDEFVWTIRNVGIDNVLLGSDFPQMTLADALDALDALDLSEAEKAKIRYGNAQRLFRLDAE